MNKEIEAFVTNVCSVSVYKFTNLLRQAQTYAIVLGRGTICFFFVYDFKNNAIFRWRRRAIAYTLTQSEWIARGIKRRRVKRREGTRGSCAERRERPFLHVTVRKTEREGHEESERRRMGVGFRSRRENQSGSLAHSLPSEFWLSLSFLLLSSSNALSLSNNLSTKNQWEHRDISLFLDDSRPPCTTFFCISLNAYVRQSTSRF